MGAEFNYYVYRESKDKLGEYHTREQEEECQTYGNDTYSGHIGIMPGGIEFAQ